MGWGQAPVIAPPAAPPAVRGRRLRCALGGVGAAVPAEKPATDFTAKQNTARLAAWRAQIRKILYVPDTLPALEAKKWSTFSPTAGVLADRVTYHTMDGMLVTAIVYRPDPKVVKWKGKLPGIVMVNGHGSDKFGWYAMYTRHGVCEGRGGGGDVRHDWRGRAEYR